MSSNRWPTVSISNKHIHGYYNVNHTHGYYNVKRIHGYYNVKHIHGYYNVTFEIGCSCLDSKRDPWTLIPTVRYCPVFKQLSLVVKFTPHRKHNASVLTRTVRELAVECGVPLPG